MSKARGKTQPGCSARAQRPQGRSHPGPGCRATGRHVETKADMIHQVSNHKSPGDCPLKRKCSTFIEKLNTSQRWGKRPTQMKSGPRSRAGCPQCAALPSPFPLTIHASGICRDPSRAFGGTDRRFLKLIGKNKQLRHFWKVQNVILISPFPRVFYAVLPVYIRFTYFSLHFYVNIT